MMQLQLVMRLVFMLSFAAMAAADAKGRSQIALKSPSTRCARGSSCIPLDRASLFLDHPSRLSLAGLSLSLPASKGEEEHQQQSKRRHRAQLGSRKIKTMTSSFDGDQDLGAPKKQDAPPTINYEINVPTRVLPDKEGLRSCTVKLIEHTFGNSYGIPYVGKYSPTLFEDPSCKDPTNWRFIELTIEGDISGRQFDRLGSIQLDGIEVLRHDNPEPSTTVTHWKFSKEMNRYYDVFRKDRSLVFDFPNIVNDVYTGSLAMSVYMTAYVADADSPRRKLSEASAIILPLSKQDYSANSFFAVGGDGTAPADDAITKLRFPANARSALVEVYASGTATDEFWYGNIPDKIYNQLDKDSAASFYPRGPYREVQVLIDGRLAGFALPYPVIFTGGINPLLWRPSVAFGAYDQPTYYIDISPFLGQLTDDAEHEIQLKVVSAEQSQEIDASWFVSGNVQVFLDKSQARTTGRITTYNAPNAGDFSIGGYVKGNVSADGTLQAETQLRSPRQLLIEAELKTGSSAKPISVRWSQEAQYSSTTTQQGPSGVTSQEAKGKDQSYHDGQPYLQKDFDFPLNLKSYYTDEVNNGTLEHAYKVTQKLDEGAISEPTSFHIEVEQKADASIKYKDGQPTSTSSSSTTVLQYKDNSGFTFDRNNIAQNRAVKSDQVSGTLSSRAGQVQ